MKHTLPHPKPRSLQLLGCTAALTVVLALTVAAPAQAQLSFSLTPSAGQLGYEARAGQRFGIKGSARQAGLSAEVGLPNGFYIGLSHSATQGGEVNLETRGSLLFSDIGLRRSDSAITFGFSVVDELNGFVGLRTGTARVDTQIDTRFNTTGYFAGLAYPLQLGPAYLSLSLAVGNNTGEWRDNFGSLKDTAFGLSGGARLTWAFNKRATAGLGLKAQRYVYSFENQGQTELTESMRIGEAFVSVTF
jgi:hypothetical protein